MNDQFSGNWDEYATLINGAEPNAVALGITDYSSIRGYQAFRKRWTDGMFPGVRFIFPNVELRLTTQTKRSRPINIHLLFSPEDPNHEELIEERLGRLRFEYQGDLYPMTRSGLMRLGKRFDPEQRDDEAAYRVGANQFKVDFDPLRTWYNEDTWLQSNCLIAIATGVDGTSGLKDDSGFAAKREEMERFADIIFSSNHSDRAFWLGPETPELKLKGGPKPCLHGCDAHHLDRILLPDEDRRCWIKGEPTFETLRQIRFEPVERTFVGPSAPGRPVGHDRIARLTVSGAEWFGNSALEFNEGLVAIIGPKGSGKTALADMIACAADAFDAGQNSASFLFKASEHLGSASANIVWGDGSQQGQGLRQNPANHLGRLPRVRYLSQQFVERLCSGDGLGRALMDEIESVVFRALDEPQRLGAENFEQLRTFRTERFLSQQDQCRDEIRCASDEIDIEHRLKDGLAAKRQQLVDLSDEIERANVELEGLVPKGEEERLKKLTELDTKIGEVEGRIAKLKIQEQKLINLQTHVEDARRRWASEHTARKTQFALANLSESQWDAFAPKFSGDVEKIISDLLKSTNRSIDAENRGDPASLSPSRRHSVEPSAELAKLVQNADGSSGSINYAAYRGPPMMVRSPIPSEVGRESLASLREKRETLESQIGADKERRKKYIKLKKHIQERQLEKERVNREIAHIEKSDERKRAAMAHRQNAYKAIFQTLVEQEGVLRDLYAPLAERISLRGEVVSKLEFSVSRRVELDTWVLKGENLLDLRRSGQLRGKGALAEHARQILVAPWQAGSPDAVAQAMEDFIQKTELRSVASFLAQHVTVGDFAKWLFSTDHIRVEYRMRYDGVDIRHLSPGARGIVLLILYLAIDDWDTRPIIADQPEENLDPQSVFDDLVRFFRTARLRRQVIIVTHNANLVVNTDADQVIIASSQRLAGMTLPKFSYQSGPLENRTIRTRVCEILEGGERAFRQREQRYALSSRARKP